MIKHSQKIIINSDIHKVWFFMIDLSRSLIFDKYYKKIVLESNYIVNDKLKFNVAVKYLNLAQLNAKIVSIHAPKEIIFQFKGNSKNIYSHKKIFKIEKFKDKTILYYYNEGTFNSKFYDMFFYYLIKSANINEIKYIKKAIESTDTYFNSSELKAVSNYK